MAHGDRQLWRIAKHTALIRADDLRRSGAKSPRGRWNSKGKAVVYASTSIALAVLETLAHLGGNINIRNAFLVRIDVPAGVWRLRETIAASDLDATWAAEPPGSTTMEIGDRWLEQGSAPLLLVPSVIVPEEYNVLINPAHRAASKITAEVVRQFVYDPRLSL